MFRFTVTASNSSDNQRGYEVNPITAYKKAVDIASQIKGGAIITVDDLEDSNTLFHTESVIGK